MARVKPAIAASGGFMGNILEVSGKAIAKYYYGAVLAKKGTTCARRHRRLAARIEHVHRQPYHAGALRAGHARGRRRSATPLGRCASRSRRPLSRIGGSETRRRPDLRSAGAAVRHGEGGSVCRVAAADAYGPGSRWTAGRLVGRAAWRYGQRAVSRRRRSLAKPPTPAL